MEGAEEGSEQPSRLKHRRLPIQHLCLPSYQDTGQVEVTQKFRTGHDCDCSTNHCTLTFAGTSMAVSSFLRTYLQACMTAQYFC